MEEENVLKLAGITNLYPSAWKDNAETLYNLAESLFKSGTPGWTPALAMAVVFDAASRWNDQTS
jgi:hypothetical protein